jgi:conjugative relaxase-like TrwC/TraI family protein
VLTVKRLKGSIESYYEEAVISGVEDYYAERLTVQGRWLGTLADQLGLDGVAEREQLRAVLDDRHPDRRTRLGLAENRTTRGFDLCFKAPKSVSILWAFADSRTVRAVEAAHDAAVDAAIGWLEQHAAWTRTGHNGIGQRRTDGFVAAAFRHRTSREHDPLVHTHVLVANSTVRHGDDHWRTLDGRHLYATAKTAGYLYQAQLRHELTARLGVAWREPVKGSAELDRVPPELVRLFSKRRAQIEARLAETGGHSLRAGEIAALATRAPKIVGVPDAALRARWTHEAIAAGYQPEKVVRAVLEHATPALDSAMSAEITFGTSSRTSSRTSPETSSAVRAARVRPASIGPSDATTIAGELVSAHGLTAHEAVFDRNDVLRAIAQRLSGGAPIREIEALADAILALDHVAHVGPVPLASRGRRGTLVSNCFTTRELLELEERALLIATTASGYSRRHTHADVEHIRAALAARPQLSVEQRHVIERLCGSDRWIDVLVAPAGAGKTTVLAASHDAWAASGITVTGAAVAGRAAHELADTARIDATTIAAFLARPKDDCGITRDSILVVDEAGMVGTRQLHELMLRAFANHARLVLVGDPHQLPEIDAGGLFAHLAQDLPTLTLTANRRQREAWERAALAQLRNGDLDTALDAYAAHGRITINDHHAATLQQCVADWAAGRASGADVVMLASLRSDVEQLNRLARTAMRDAGHLTGAHVNTITGAFQVGDEIVCLRNNRRLELTNGTRGVIIDTDPRRRTLTIKTITGEHRTIPVSYLDQGHVTHGYALTVHKAQGLTTERVYAVIGDDAYRELGYTALSRGRTTNQLYITRTDDEWTSTKSDPVVDLQHALGVSRQQRLATEHRGPRLEGPDLSL